MRKVVEKVIPYDPILIVFVLGPKHFNAANFIKLIPKRMDRTLHTSKHDGQTNVNQFKK